MQAGRLVNTILRFKQQVLSALHQRFPELFSVPFIASLQTSLQPPNKATLGALPQDQREKEENARVLRQRSLLRIYAELELVGIAAPAGKALGEATFTIFRDLVSNWLDIHISPWHQC